LLAGGVAGRELEDAAAHRDRMLRPALIAIRDRDRARELGGIVAPPGFVQCPRHHHAEPEVVRLVAEPLLELLELGHDGVNDTCALNVIPGRVGGSAHLLATVRMQLSNVSPSDGAKFERLNWPDGAKLAETDSVTVFACRPVFFLSACS